MAPFRADQALILAGRSPADHASRVGPAVVIGIGPYGRQVFEACRQAGLFAPAAPQPPAAGLWAGEGGWQAAGGEALDNQAGNAAAPEAWWATHGAEAIARVQAAALSVQHLAATARERPVRATLDLIVLFHLHQALGRAIWRQIVAAARRAAVPFADDAVTLIVATDSSSFAATPEAEAQAMLRTVAGLAEELRDGAAPNEPPGRVAWCYLLDANHALGGPVTALRAQTDPAGADAAQLRQAHLAAELIRLLLAGLRSSPDYAETTSARVARRFGFSAPTALASSFSAGSLVFPGRDFQARARDRLALQLLQDHVFGRETAAHQAHARRLRTRSEVELELAPAALRRRLELDAAGQVIGFSVEPPRLTLRKDGLTGRDEDLADKVMNWETVLWGRWRHPNSAAAQVKRRADAQIDTARQWLTCELSSVLAREAGGVHLANAFLTQAEHWLNAQVPLLTAPAAAAPVHWLERLLAGLRAAPPEKTELPDLEASRRRLKAAVRRRLIPKAVWVRAGLFTSVLLAFGWAAYRATGDALGLTAWMASWTGQAPLEGMALALLALGAAGLAAAAGAWRLYGTDHGITVALGRLVGDVQRKYAALLEQALRAQQVRVYTEVMTELDRWRRAVRQRQDRLTAAVADLQAALEAPAASLLLFELPLAEGGAAGLDPAYTAAEAASLAEQHLGAPESARWRSEQTQEIVARLRALAARELAPWVARLNLAQWTEAPGGPGNLRSRLLALKAALQPAWPLGREERGSVLLDGPTQTSAGTPAGSLSTLVVHHAGLPVLDGEDLRTAANRHLPAGTRWHPFAVAGQERLAYVVTLHGLPLERLRAWHALRRAAGTAPQRPPRDTPVPPGAPAAAAEGLLLQEQPKANSAEPQAVENQRERERAGEACC